MILKMYFCGNFFKMYTPEILYEDNHIIAINKQASQIVQGDKTGDKPLVDLLKDYIKKRDNKPGNVFVGVAHRLDRPVSGVILFAKTSKALTRLNELIKNRELDKTYWSIVKNKPAQDSELLINYLIKNEKQNKSYVCDKEQKGALKAELEYKMLAKSTNYYLLEIKLYTGRHHQIRVQLSNIGCPIKGDLKYGFARSNPDASISLHARSVEFIHPIKKETIKIIAPVPEDNLWKSF